MIPKTLLIDAADLRKVSLEGFTQFTTWHANSRFFQLPPGKEHYALLGALGMQFGEGVTIADMGTYLGYSALALSLNPNTTVITYDIKDWIPANVASAKNRPNIVFRLQDCVQAVHQALDCPLILLDVDPHDGKQEREFIERLIKAKYRGVVIMDDIFLNRAMRECWKWIPIKKIDATRMGHFSGTGIVLFDPDYINVTIR